MSESCPVCYALLSSHKQQRQYNTAVQCSLVIQRYALSDKGGVGSLYDCWIDNISRESIFDRNFINEEETNSIAKCQVINDNMSNDDDFLGILDIEDELWLSIALKMTPFAEKTTVLFDYRIPPTRSVRFLHYYRIDRHVRLIDDSDIPKHALSTTLKNTKATHIITDVKEGIDFIIILEFANPNSNEIDSILNKVCKYFIRQDSNFLSEQEQEKLNQLTPTIFSRISKICSFQRTKNFSEICQHIHQYLFEQKQTVPLFYTLHPIKIPSADTSLGGGEFFPLDSTIMQKIRKRIVKLSNKFKTMQYLFDEIQSSSLSKYLESHYDKVFDNVKQVKNMYKDVRGELATIVLKCRQEGVDPSAFDQELKNIQHKTVNTEVESLNETMLQLRNKARFITQLETDYGLEYYNVADLEEKSDHQRTLETKIVSLHYQQLTHFLCSSDELVNKDATQHKKLCEQLMKERKTNSSLRIMFADFSYCKLILPVMNLLQTNLESSIPPVTKASSIVTKASSIESKELNILLLGETGIGKSTFINAFGNYLAFRSIGKAERDGPIVLIPVSFVMTSDNQSGEYEVKLGEENNFNEDFNHPGCTITQQCQSYTFNLGNNTKLRLIDTPGIGDTRGISQDDKNIQSILSYVNHLSHLNAVCILLKPNTTRLHVLFRSCLEQIFDFLGPNARDNIIFCFTSSRSTFFVPGSTAPLLKKMLNDLPADHTPQLTKANIFCFDSESFRYLAAMKSSANVQFNDDQKADFQISWDKSVGESIRLIDSIKSRPHYEMNTWHSIKHAQIIITSLIRPILETIRYNLRNRILNDTEKKQYSMELQAKSVLRPSYFCISCPFEIIHKNIFPMIDHPVHQYEKLDKSDKYQCDYDKHVPILYKLKYKLNPIQNNRLDPTTKDMRDRLLEGSVRFGYFLLHMARIDKDPFLPWLDLFIQEEDFLHSQKSSNSLNEKLHKQLLKLKDEYKEQLDNQETNIDKIYRWIEKIQANEMVTEQMNVIRESQTKMMQHYEHDISSAYPNIDMSLLFTRSNTQT